MRTATLDGNIKLSSSDGTEIPCTVTASGYKTAVVAPQSGELAAGDYTVALTSSKTAATGIKTATGGYVTSGTTLTATVKDDSKTQANNVVFTANDGFELTALESGTITGKTSCKNDTGAAINPVLVLGLFKDGNLEDVKFESKPAAVDSTVELSTQIDVPENVDKTYKLVSYLWTGIDTLVPIADTKTLTTDGFELWTDIAYSKGDGGAYTTTYDVANYKPSTVGEVYVSASSGDDENNDGTGEKPFKTLEKALSSSKDSLTVHLAKGEYAVGGATPSGRNLALIGDEDGVVISTAASLDWSETGENSGIYKAVVASSANTANGSATSVIETVWDTKNADAYGDFKFMSKADSAALTDEGTFYYDSANSTLYVKPYGDSTTDDIRAYYAADNIEFSTANTLYMQNIDLEGGRVGCVRVQNNSAKLYAKDVTFKYAGYSANGGLTMTSGEAYLQNCTAAANVKDGFNYHKNTNGISKGVEINCIGRNNGFDGKNNNNGSTSHDGCMVFRFCGEYFNNQGPNVADVHDGTKTMNIGCKAYSSRATNNGYKYDYEAGQGAAKMWLTDCTAPNSESAYAGHVSGASESYAYSTFYLSGCNFSISGTGRKINLD